jgi:hypothetical protein
MNLSKITNDAFQSIKNFKSGHGRYSLFVSGESKYGDFTIEYRLLNNEINQIWVSERIAPNHSSEFVVTPNRFNIIEQLEEAEKFFDKIIKENNFDEIKVRCFPADMEEIYNDVFEITV